MSLVNYPAINPTLLMDFANSAKLDSRFQPNRASTATVMGSGGYIIGVGTQLPRFRYNAFTGACEGYLVEGQRTNLMTYSQEINTTNWNAASGSTITQNATTAPDGSTTASKLIVANGQAEAWFAKYDRAAINFTSGVKYAFSAYFKAAELNTVDLVGDVRDAGGINAMVRFTLTGDGSTSVIVSTGLDSYSIEKLPNGWYRCTMVATADTTTSEEPGCRVLGPGNGSSGLFMWGYQVEEGPFATSYIPTSASQVTRAADIPYIDSGENFTTIGGTLLFEGSPREDGNSGLYTFLTGFFSGSTERLCFTASSTGGNLNVQYGATVLTLGSLPSTPTPIKLIGAFDASGLAACRDGGAVSTSGALTLGGANRYFVGNSFFGSGTYTAVNGVIKKIAYWPSKLTNTQLQTLTS